MIPAVPTGTGDASPLITPPHTKTTAAEAPPGAVVASILISKLSPEHTTGSGISAEKHGGQGAILPAAPAFAS